MFKIQMNSSSISRGLLLALASALGCINYPPVDIADGDTSTDGDGDGDGQNHGAPCSSDDECESGHCFVIPFITGRCGECDEDVDCPDGGCSSFNPFGTDAPTCNVGQQAAGCESHASCKPGLSCVSIVDVLDVIHVDTCSACVNNLDCNGSDICAPVFDIPTWQGSWQCMQPGALAQDSYCLLDGNGDEACASGICSVVDVLGLTQIGACGECITDADCDNGACVAGSFMLASGGLAGSTCQ